jgi:RES domain-containing protein
LIRVWRLCQAIHQAAAFDGEGARRYGGRWNPKGRAVVYTAATLSLAALEILVHADGDLLAVEFAAFAVDIPDAVPIESVVLDDLPARWGDEFPALICRRWGCAWLDRAETAVLAVPSAIIPAETNYLLNPAHPDFAKLVIGAPAPFAFDPRLYRGE